MFPTPQIPKPLAEAITDPISLRFADLDLETRYQIECVTRFLGQTRVALILGIVFYSAFGLLDDYLIPAARPTAWLIRFGLAFPIGVVVLALSYFKRSPVWIECSFGLVGLVGGVGIAGIVAVAQQPGSYLYYVGFLLVALFGFTLLRLRFVTASALAWAVFAMYLVVALWINPMPPAIVVSNVFFFASFNVIGMVASYSLETYNRSDFLQRRIILEQTEHLRETLFEVEVRRREAEEHARVDPLTSLFNRRHFFSMLDYSCGQEQATTRDTAVLILDLDHFKQVNDTYGHLIGDQVLQSVAQMMRLCLRPGDVPCRYGGEEFAVLLPRTTLAEAQSVGERLCRAFAATAISTEKGPITVTVSVGVACLAGDDPADVDALLERADRALYRAKHAGRNQVGVHEATGAILVEGGARVMIM